MQPNANENADAKAKANAKYETDAPETKEQAQELLKNFYNKGRLATPESPLPKRPQLLSWKLNEDGVMVIIDGASGRKLEFVTEPEKQAAELAEEQFEDAEIAALDAEAKAEALEAEAVAAEAAAKAARDKANKEPFAHVKKATKEENKKGK